MSDELSFWTIYKHPLDHPTGYVTRRWVIRTGSPALAAEGTYVDTLAEARAALPPGRTCIAKDKADDPTVVESWI